MQDLSYWQLLQKTKLYSLKRRRDHYNAAIYTWRILENHVPNLTSSPIKCQWNERRGRLCQVPNVSQQPPAAIQSIRRNSFAIRGPTIFNALPITIRNITNCDTDQFKEAAIDKYLATIPDQPLIPGLTMYRRIESNYLADWASHVSVHGPVSSGETDLRSDGVDSSS